MEEVNGRGQLAHVNRVPYISVLCAPIFGACDIPTQVARIYSSCWIWIPSATQTLERVTESAQITPINNNRLPPDECKTHRNRFKYQPMRYKYHHLCAHAHHHLSREQMALNGTLYIRVLVYLGTFCCASEHGFERHRNRQASHRIAQQPARRPRDQAGGGAGVARICRARPRLLALSPSPPPRPPAACTRARDECYIIRSPSTLWLSWKYNIESIANVVGNVLHCVCMCVWLAHANLNCIQWHSYA